MPTLATDDLNIYYEIHGEGPPLIFLHGLGSSTRDWEYQIEFFAGRYQVIAMDFRGHGQSGKPPGPYSVQLFAADTVKLLKALNLGPAHIAGLSMGGMVAFQMAVDTPELIASLTIINSGPELVFRSFAERMAFLQRSLIIRCLGIKYMAQVLAKILLPEPHQKTLQKQLLQRWAQNDKKAYLASLQAITGWSVADRISAIQAPTLVISADQDYTPIAFKEAYIARMPMAELAIINNSRHLSPIDQPEQVNTAIQNFLSRHSPA